MKYIPIKKDLLIENFIKYDKQSGFTTRKILIKMFGKTGLLT